MSIGQPPPPPAAEQPILPKPHLVRHHKIPVPTVAGAAAAAVLSIFGAFVVAVLIYRRFRCNRTAPSSPSDLKPTASTPPAPRRRFTYSQLCRATSSFSPSLKLGQGGFGPVFRGALPSGQEIAVKLMDSGSLQGEREFQNELALAAKMITVGSLADRGRVVVPLGFCVDEARGKWRRRWAEKKEANEDEEVVVGSIGLGKRVLLVYELMHNGSLQDALLGRRSPELLDWGRRFSIAVDIAKGLQFLHEVCDPPVIHGDIKPSNILLDSRFAAKIADFGLAWLKAAAGAEEVTAAAAGQLDEEEIVVVEIDLKSPKNGKKEQAEDDASVIGVTVAESATTAGFEEASGCQAGCGIVVVDKSLDEFDGGFARTPEGDEMLATALEVASTSEDGGYDRMTVESRKEPGTSSSRRGYQKKSGNGGKDWWWRQDNNGGGNANSRGVVKDYVMEWIRSEIKKERPKSDWITAPAVASEDCLPRTLGRSDRRRKHQRRLEWWASLDEERLKKEKKSRPAREWWREEFCEELTKKQQRKRMISKSMSTVEGGGQQQWWQEDDDCALPLERKKRRKKKSWSRSSHTSMDWWMDGLSGEVKRTMTGRRRSQDWANGTEIPKSSGTISSTPSMRGTVCYVAPEYGGGGPLSEKCDIYSFGVLLLVLISGRRPLQVTASPMSEFERANLISWARHLAHLGRLLELVDSALKAVDKEQALLCITVALLCIQRSPAHRPSIKEIVGMLTGQSEPPHEFSPSPPGGFPFKSGKKAW